MFCLVFGPKNDLMFHSRWWPHGVKRNAGPGTHARISSGPHLGDPRFFREWSHAEAQTSSEREAKRNKFRGPNWWNLGWAVAKKVAMSHETWLRFKNCQRQIGTWRPARKSFGFLQHKCVWFRDGYVMTLRLLSSLLGYPKILAVLQLKRWSK